MTHPTDDQLCAALFDADPAHSAHLAACPTCAARAAALHALALDFDLARRSQPAPAALRRLHALAALLPAAPTPLAGIARQVRALLMLDTRRGAALHGVRSVNAAAAYRLLYTSANADVELLVESEADLLRITGEVLPLHETARLPALIQLEPLDAAVDASTATETNAAGRFGLGALAPGRYGLWVAFAGDDAAFDLVIDELEIG